MKAVYDMDGQFYCFELNSADGHPHKYKCLPHKATEGAALSMKLVRVGVEPLGALLTEAAKADDLIEKVAKELAKSDATGKDGLLDKPVTELLTYIRDVDFGEVGGHLASCLKELDVEDLQAILRNTFRDGQKLGGDNTLNFDKVYSANYLEMYQAAYHAARINGFFPGLDMYSDDEPEKREEK